MKKTYGNSMPIMLLRVVLQVHYCKYSCILYCISTKITSTSNFDLTKITSITDEFTYELTVTVMNNIDTYSDNKNVIVIMKYVTTGNMKLLATIVRDRYICNNSQ